MSPPRPTAACGTPPSTRVRLEPKTEKVDVFPLPKGTPNVNLNIASFDNAGIL